MCRGFKALVKKSVDFQILGQQPMDLVELMNWQRHKYSSYGWFQNTFNFFLKWECALKGVDPKGLDEIGPLPPVLGKIVPRWQQPQKESEEDLAFSVQIAR